MKTDLELQEEVMDELQQENILNAAEIGVAVKGGVVILTGMVDCYAKKLAAEHAAKKVEGVSVVAGDIEIAFPGRLKRQDSEIAHAILEALKERASIKEDRVKVKVEHGWVTVEGDVDQQYQKESIKYCIEYIKGVKGVNNLIKVMPRLFFNSHSVKNYSRVKIAPSLIRSVDREMLVVTNS